MAKIVVINPGHDVKRDSGAVNGTTALREADVTLSVAKKVEGYLEAVGYKVVIVQSNELEDIVDQANKSNADLFVSIHCNSFSDPQANGTETYYYNGSQNGKRLAGLVQNQLVGEFGLFDRGVKTAGYYVIKYTDMPAILTELAFISNMKEAELLATEQDRFARAVARGISDYFK